MIDERERSGARHEGMENSQYSHAVKAGKRTYFFDVKSTRSDDFYITITESKRRMEMDRFVYEKHKIFLYKEDFEKFAEGLHSAIAYINENKGDNGEFAERNTQLDDTKESSFSDISFDDLE